MLRAPPRRAPRPAAHVLRPGSACMVAACAVALVACGSDVPTPAGPSDPAAAAIVAAVRQAYAQEFNASVPRPAIFNDTLATYCHGGHLMTTAYLPAPIPGTRLLLGLYMRRDGRQLVSTSDGGFRFQTLVHIIPAGRFRVLTVVAAHPATWSPASDTLLAEAQAAINAQHRAFAASRGYPEPIVEFVFTNVAIPAGEIEDPRSRSSVHAALGAHGVSTEGFDFLVVLNPDPGRLEGGFATVSQDRPHFVYMGNYNGWTSELTPAGMTSIARASYHHEIGHHWGWRHDWVRSCGGLVGDDLAPFAPFITAPMLFGWEDTDGDGIPEILDPRPYGR